MFFNRNICQNLHISVLILGFIFNILLPIYKHVCLNKKQSPRILYLSIILESLKNTLLLTLDSSKVVSIRAKNFEKVYMLREKAGF